MAKILILGASGLVGGEALALALADPRVEHVVAPTRRALAGHSKLINPTAPDLDAFLPDPDWAVDAVVCALGTTMAKAGSREAFRHVDFTLPTTFARRARSRGATTLALVSSAGASQDSRIFYLRTKGEVEREMASIGFESLTVLRPGMIGGDRNEVRTAELLTVGLVTRLGSILPKSLRINPAPQIAKLLIEAAVAAEPGRRMIQSKDIVDLASSP